MVATQIITGIDSLTLIEFAALFEGILFKGTTQLLHAAHITVAAISVPLKLLSTDTSSQWEESGCVGEDPECHNRYDICLTTKK